MNILHSTRRMIGVGALGLGLLAVPAIASAAPVASHQAPTAVVTAVTTTTAPVTTPTTTPKTVKVPVVKTYSVIAGTYRTQARADKRLATITAKGVTGLTVDKIGKTARTTRYRVEETGLTRVAAKTLWKQLRKAHFFAFFTAR